jgi:hypothetical protein
MNELYGFLEQSNISPKNIARVEALTHHASSDVRQLAMLILEVARVKPHRRRRWEFLARDHAGLFARLKELCPDDVSEDALDCLNSGEPDLPF